MGKSALIANGEVLSLEKLGEVLLGYQRVIAVDGGLKYLLTLKKIPHLIVGDQDSSEKDLWAQFVATESIALVREKDKTDLEVAIEEEIKRGAKSITLFGSWGKRIDHSLTNALILGRYPDLLTLETERETLFAVQEKKVIPCEMGQTISLLPIFGPAIGVSTKGLKWELKKKRLDMHFMSISNLSIDKRVEISIEEGSLLCSVVKIGEEA